MKLATYTQCHYCVNAICGYIFLAAISSASVDRPVSECLDE